MDNKPVLLGLMIDSATNAVETATAPLIESPAVYATMAVTFALIGGFVVQFRAMVYRRTTRIQAISELLYCGLAGLVAYYIAAKNSVGDIDLYFIALVMGMAGRPLMLLVQGVATNSILQALGGICYDRSDEENNASRCDHPIPHRGFDEPRSGAGAHQREPTADD